jgi:hypothetical protein
MPGNLDLRSQAEMAQDVPPPSDQQHLRASHVYLDASVYRALQFDWGGRWLSALADLAHRGLVRVVVTDITLREVTSLMREMWSEANKSTQRFAVVLGQLGFGDTVSVMADEEACVVKLREAFEHWLWRCNVWTCKYDAGLPAIMDDYFGGRPPFGVGKKKAEFPDAIVASMLRAWCAATKQVVYVVSRDSDLKACCAPEGPLIHAGSVAEVVSHGTASAAVHAAVMAALKESDWFFRTMQAQIAHVSFQVETGYHHGGETEVEIESVKLEDMSIYEVFILNFDGTNMTCSVNLIGELALCVRVEREPVQYSEKDWPSGYRHTQWVNMSALMPATVTAKVAEDGSVEFADAQLDESPFTVSWSVVEPAMTGLPVQ